MELLTPFWDAAVIIDPNQPEGRVKFVITKERPSDEDLQKTILDSMIRPFVGSWTDPLDTLLPEECAMFGIEDQGLPAIEALRPLFEESAVAVLADLKNRGAL